MKHSVTLNLLIEGDVEETLNSIRSLVGRYNDKIEVTGLNIYQEHSFKAPMTTGVRERETELEVEEETKTQSLDEEKQDG